MTEERADVVVVGAGFAGLAAAKAYHQCDASASLIILDANASLGGVWAKEKIYDGLRSNNLLGTFELPDLPFQEAWGVKPGEHIPGLSLHTYLTEYAKKFDILDKLRLRTKVLEAARVEDSSCAWRLTVKASDQQYTLLTKRLIVATGLTYQPNSFNIKGQENYKAPILGPAQLAPDSRAVVKDPAVKRVTVLGGSKSSYDAVYMFASAGKEIDWVISKGGHGPTYMARPYIQLGPLGKFWLETLVTRRAMTWMSPCIWSGHDYSDSWRSFLHGTWLGRKIVDIFWWKVGSDTVGQSGLLDDEKLKPLIPDCAMFDMASGLAILNYPTDIHDYVKSGQVQIHRQDIKYLDEHKVHLANDEVLVSDAFIASTGWSHGTTINFSDTTLHSELGIPSTHYTADESAFWETLDKRADEEIFARFPMLKDRIYPPQRPLETANRAALGAEPIPTPAPDTPLSPWRLYRHVAPPGLSAKDDRSLAFAGMSFSINGHIRNEIAGLWIYAYMNDKLTVDPRRSFSAPDLYYHTALWTRFCYRRYSYGFGAIIPDMVFDSVPWNDVLLDDLGLSGQRKGGGFWNWREWFEPYLMADYRGVTAEWLAKNGSVSVDGKIRQP